MAEAANAVVRATSRRRRVPVEAQCTICGCNDPRVLQQDGKDWLCYECANCARGRPTEEAHHVLPKSVDPTVTVTVPGNMHRVLSELQRELPKAVREVAPRDPLAWVITVLSAVHDFAQTAVHYMGAAIAWLLRLWEALKAQHGRDWWASLGLPGIYAQPAQ
jgi:hypothetical protein